MQNMLYIYIIIITQTISTPQHKTEWEHFVGNDTHPHLFCELNLRLNLYFVDVKLRIG